jgi:hypothetical protein
VNITCNFLYCNHQVHRDFLITVYIQGLSKISERYKHVPVRNTTLPLMKYGVQYIRTHLKFIWSAPNYFVIQPLGGRLTSCKTAANVEARLAAVRLSY